LDAFADHLADSVTGMTRGALIDRSLAPLSGLGQMSIDGDVRSDPSCPQGFHETRDVKAFVSSQCDALPARAPAIDHGKRRLALGRTVGLGELGPNHQTVAILHQDVAHEAEFGFPAIALAIKLSLGTG